MKSIRLSAFFLPLLLVLGSFIMLPETAQAACSGGPCVGAGPRLASVDSSRSVLLNALLGDLLGTSVNLTVADWNAIAEGDVNLASYLNALQTQVGVSSPSQALSVNATLAQLVSAMAVAAQADGDIALVNALNSLKPQVAGLSGTIKLGDLLSVSLPNGALSSVKINALDLVTGAIQLYNYRNVVTTPSPVTISGSAIGLGSVINSVQLYAQIIEPPTYVCGGVGTIFSILRYDHASKEPKQCLLQAGVKQVAAGYVLYGSSTVFALSIGMGVDLFVLDPAIGAFIRVAEQVKIPRANKSYSLNEGNRLSFLVGGHRRDHQRNAIVRRIIRKNDRLSWFKNNLSTGCSWYALPAARQGQVPCSRITCPWQSPSR